MARRVISIDEKELERQLTKFVNNDKDIQKLEMTLKVLKGEQKAIGDAIKPLMTKNKVIYFKSLEFYIETSGKTSTPYKMLLAESLEKLSGLSVKIYNEMVARQKAETKVNKTKKLAYRVAEKEAKRA